MEALAAAAVAAGPQPPSGGQAGEAAWAFPVFVGFRRRLAPSDPLFEAGNIEREQLARQAAVACARDERRQLSREAALGDPELSGLLHVAFECAECHASLPTRRLLDLHVSELHDSFFAAQAARRMPVYLCLVEGCPRRFCTVEERKQHLSDHHQFPRHFHFDRLHLRRRASQIRPLPRFRKGHGRQSMDAEGEQPQQAVAEEQAAAAAGGAQQAAAPAGPAPAEAVALSLSRLTMAAETSTVPDVIHFGRGRGRGLVGRGRGSRGGQQAAVQTGAAPPAEPQPQAPGGGGGS